MFYLIGLGLADAQDITLRGLQALQTCSHIYLESYTSILSHMQADVDHESPTPTDGANHDLADASFWAALHTGLEHLQHAYSLSVPIQLADRYHVEQAQADHSSAPHMAPMSSSTLSTAPTSMSCMAPLDLNLAKSSNIALLVVGDPLSATTHTDLVLRCVSNQIPYTVIHNTSILTAIGMTGLSLYKFTPTLSIPFFTESWQPTSFYLKLAAFRCNHLDDASSPETLALSAKDAHYHTLCLLDIKVKEPTLEEMARGRPVPRHFMPPRFMTVNL
jgi:diphthine methyl ester synthase